MSLQTPKTITEVFTANRINTGFVCTLLQCQELALAVNLQGRWAVMLETSQHGIFCETWDAKHNAQHFSHVRLDCFYSKPDFAIEEICDIAEHLTTLLHNSAGGAQ